MIYYYVRYIPVDGKTHVTLYEDIADVFDVNDEIKDLVWGVIKLKNDDLGLTEYLEENFIKTL